MIGEGRPERDLAALVVPRSGGWSPRVIGMSLTGWSMPDGAVVEAVTAFFRDLLAAGRAESTVRSYGMDLLRWFRFFWADPGCPGTGRPVSRPGTSAGGCRSPASSPAALARPARPVAAAGRVRRTRRRCARTARRCCAASTTFTWMRAPGRSSTRSRWTAPGGAGGRTRTTIRWSPTATSAAGLYRPRVPAGSRAASRMRSSTRSSRRLPSHRDRALVAFYVSTGARASELLSATVAGSIRGGS